MRLARSARLAALVLLAVACSSDVGVVDPLGPDTTGGGGPTVQRVTLALTVAVAAADVPIATAIGSPGGVLRQATVVVRRSGSADSLLGTTDAAGRVTFSNVLAGSYSVSVVRLLSATERAQLDSGAADVTAFGGAGSVAAQPASGTSGVPTVAATVSAVAGRRGSLVISELWAHAPSLPAGGYYYTGDYLELYNNSDTTIYLDGKAVGVGLPVVRDYASRPCTMMAHWRTDPLGIWSAWFYAFPGTGRQYPLAPGQAAVVATDAIDHRQFLPQLIDLSHADFEFPGSTDVDNPSVPNMINIGIREKGASYPGHGLTFASNDVIVFVTNPLDTATLVHDDVPGNNPDYARIPRNKLLDVFTSIMISSLEQTIADTPPCPELVNAGMDAGFARLLDWNADYGILRRPLYRLSNGRLVLQRTMTSARDFMIGSPSPGQVP